MWEWIPPWILTMLNFGMAYPDGDEDDLWALGDAWKQAAADLEALIPDIKAATDSAQKFYIGDGSDKVAAEFAKLFGDNPESVHNLAKGLEDLGEKTREAGTEVEYTKIMEATFAAITAYSVISLIAAWPWGSAAVPVALAAGREAVTLAAEQGARQLAAQVAKAGLRNIIKPYLKEIGITALKAGGAGLALDTGIQGYQVLDGHRNNIDVSQAARTALEWGDRRRGRGGREARPDIALGPHPTGSGHTALPRWRIVRAGGWSRHVRHGYRLAGRQSARERRARLEQGQYQT
ncbi:hypothetical protein AB0L82_23110 [Nocardia sp. NPDC052001]|uniref:WXG100-like domain-containing protein n=1 Tax=Nocardia sp. NPDC052001 TaxID=3154853 RepID=UPI00343C8B0E